MSHVETVKVNITDLDALKKACERLGVEFREGQTHYEWFGHSVGDYPVPAGLTKADLGHCAHAIHVSGVSYEVGLVPNKVGKGYTLAYDFWGPGQGLQKKFCKPAGRGYTTGMEKLVDAYSVEVLKRKAYAQGYRVSEFTLPDGKIRLTVTL